MNISNQFQIDWLEFTVEVDSTNTVISILHFNLNFKVFLKESPRSETKEFSTSSEEYSVLITYLPRWKKYSLRFSGSNADYFYSKFKTNAKEINVLFSKNKNPRISRLDVKYCRKPKSSDVPSVRLFLHRCEENIYVNHGRLHASISRGVRGNRLTIGSRKSALYYRVYESAPGSLDFELEIKKRSLVQFQEPFFENNFLKFEELLEKQFSDYSRKYLLNQMCYMDWLAEYLRSNPAHQEKIVKCSEKNFVVDYIQQSTLTSQSNKEYFYRLLQLLSFLHAIKKTSYELDTDLVYHKFEFKIVDFLAYTGQENSIYQVKKTAIFLESLLNLDPVTTINFSNKSYRKFVCFPNIQVKRVGKYLTTRVIIVGDLYEHCYPFLLPEKFLVANSKHSIDVKLELLNVLTQPSTEKLFKSEDFLSGYNISNQKKYNIKTLILESFLMLVDSKKIEKKFKITTKKDFIIEARELTLELISNSRWIYFYEKIE